MMGTKKDNYYAILMAGGVGSRFWPTSKAANPKQFQDILGVGETLFQATFRRLSRLIPAENIYVLTNKDYVDIIKDQVPTIHMNQIVAEPEMRNTAPSILLGALKIQKTNKDARILVAPCDHWIKDETAFIETVEKGFEHVGEEDRLITIGIKPTSPNTGYGYIKYKKEDSGAFKKVEQFTEKPGKSQAEEFIKAGNYAWNAGIFIWKASFIIESFKSHLKEMHYLFDKGKESWNTKDEVEFLNANYGLAANISIDYGIMEKSEHVVMIPASFDWNDLGTWSSVQHELPADDAGNTVINSRLVAENSSGNIISTTSKKIVVMKDLSDYIIVDDEDVLLIIPKADEQEIKQLRAKVMKDFGDQLG
ncbi:mannose-1-phosphate guanylyltransferase [Christiangramia aquimixticola]|uniref:mannose-1-phosphate guanylyltransferase n=1 Tax=Christiangramia aquimixticola TaxID=1697558 RepID=UPI003AA9A1F6